MTNIKIRNLDDDVKTRLRTADNGRFIEEKTRLILRVSRHAPSSFN